MGEVRLWRADRCDLAQVPRGRGRAVKVAQAVHHPLCRLGICSAGGQARGDPSRGDQRDIPLHPVKHRNDRRAHQHRIRHAKGVGVHLGKMFDQPDHVIAKIAKEARRHRRQSFGHGDPAFRDQRPQRVERVAVQWTKGRGVKTCLSVDLACPAPAAPDKIGLHAHDGIATAHLATGDGFQHEGVRAGIAQLQHQADRGIKVSRQPRPDDLVLAPGPSSREDGEVGGKLHQGRLVLIELITA